MVKHMGDNRRIGFYPWHFSIKDHQTYDQALSVSDSVLVPLKTHPVISAWQDRPADPLGPALVYPIEYAGESAGSKIERMAEHLNHLGCDAAVVNTLDDLAWLFNIRGDDIPCNTVVNGMGVFQANGRADLFVNPQKITAQFRAGLDEQIQLNPADAFDSCLADLGKTRAIFLVDPVTCPVGIRERILDAGGKMIEHPGIVGPARACRNPVEQAGARRAQTLDCAALVKVIAWIKHRVEQGQLTEFEIFEKLIDLRRSTAPGLFMKPSFDSLVSSGPNATLGHYRPTAEHCRTLCRDELLLMDSGGQYLCSTTDITRTLAFSEPDQEKKFWYARVLKGLIALSDAVFPYGTCGMQIDILAKQALWQSGATYVHGTGHGIGSYLGVHEGPHRIAGEKNAADAVIQPGMMFANEPSYRIQGEYCIRIENDLLTVVKDQPPFDAFGRWLGFETLTFLPFERLLLSPEYFEDWEIDWINRYHSKTCEVLTPLLVETDPDALHWLRQATQPM